MLEHKRHIHIVALDVPYPPNYGGRIDMFYKIQSLYNEGVGIYLHCFIYGETTRSTTLEKYCKKVYYYPRKHSIFNVLSLIPFIVQSRKNKVLYANLVQDNLPILFEGVHTTYYLKKLSKQNRKIYLRPHNIEHLYYAILSKKTKQFWKCIFFYTESIKLKYYEKIVSKCYAVISISEKDVSFFRKYNKYTYCVPCFHSSISLDIITEAKGYVLYHGDLKTNYTAIQFLIQHVFRHINKRVIIAGKSPTKHLLKLCQNYKNIDIISNPSEEQLKTLVQYANISVLFSHQSTGIPLKLIACLSYGKHIIINQNMFQKGIENTVYICNTPKEYIDTIYRLFDVQFTKYAERQHVFNTIFSNVNNAKAFCKILNS